MPKRNRAGRCAQVGCGCRQCVLPAGNSARRELFDDFIGIEGVFFLFTGFLQPSELFNLSCCSHQHYQQTFPRVTEEVIWDDSTVLAMATRVVSHSFLLSNRKFISCVRRIRVHRMECFLHLMGLVHLMVGIELGLDEIKFAFLYNQPLPNIQLPIGIVKVSFGDHFSHLLPVQFLPPGIRHLAFGNRMVYHKVIDARALPSSLTTITFGGSSNAKLLDPAVFARLLIHDASPLHNIDIWDTIKEFWIK